MTNKTAVVIVGSANMDLVVAVERFPRAGETVLGGDFAMFPGGKGANQAVACAKLGGEAVFIGKMGRDAFQEKLVESLERDGVRLEHMLYDPAEATGTALIAVDASGQNEIIVASGSNMKLTPADLDACDDVLRSARVVLLQLETPLDTVAHAVQRASEHGALVILNPAPARALPADLLRHVDLLTPNETEASLLSGVEVTDVASAEAAARRLREMGVRHVIVTLGARGALLVSEDRVELYPAYRVQPVDTTAAGDAFNGALAYALARGMSLDEAIPLACRVGAFSVTRRGAQTSMPTHQELVAFNPPLAESSAVPS